MGESTKQNRAALVTGSARRIGKAIAKAIGSDGWNVAVHYNHSASEAEALVDDMRSRGVHAIAVKCDLSDAAAVAGLISECNGKLGPLTCLINNASLFEIDDPLSFEPDKWDRHAAINLRAPLQLTREFAEQVPKQSNGCVINMLDQKVFNLNSDFFSYTLTKVAMEAATRMLAMALAPRVRVCGIAPGITLISGNQTQQGFERAHASAPLGHSSDVDDVVAAVRYIIAAKSMTGDTMLIDGGQHLWPMRRDVQFEAK